MSGLGLPQSSARKLYDASVGHFGRNIFVRPSVGKDTFTGKTWTAPLKTAQKAHDIAKAGDHIWLGPGSYEEVLTIIKSHLHFHRVAAPGMMAIEPTGANDIAIVVDGTAARREGIVLEGLSAAGKGTGGGLHLKGNIRDITVIGGKYENADETGFGARLESTAAGSVGRVSFVPDPFGLGVEFALAATALHFKVSGGGDPVTQTLVKGCRFNRFATRGVHVDTVHAADLWLHDNKFGRKEDGTEPSDEYVLAAVASTSGQLQGNYFPAAKATGKISLAATVIKSGNHYTDGEDA